MRPRRFRKSERKAISRTLSRVLGRVITIERVECCPEVILRGGAYLVTGRSKIILTILEAQHDH